MKSREGQINCQNVRKFVKTLDVETKCQTLFKNSRWEEKCQTVSVMKIETYRKVPFMTFFKMIFWSD